MALVPRERGPTPDKAGNLSPKIFSPASLPSKIPEKKLRRQDWNKKPRRRKLRPRPLLLRKLKKIRRLLKKLKGKEREGSYAEIRYLLLTV